MPLLKIDGKEIEIDLTVTKEKYEDVVSPIFQKAIDISQKLLKNNKFSGSDLETILMIGGPTFSETFREMLRNQITSNLNTSIDPMTAVAKGAPSHQGRLRVATKYVNIARKFYAEQGRQADLIKAETKFFLETIEPGFCRSNRFLQCFLKSTTNRHDLTH